MPPPPAAAAVPIQYQYRCFTIIDINQHTNRECISWEGDFPFMKNTIIGWWNTRKFSMEIPTLTEISTARLMTTSMATWKEEAAGRDSCSNCRLLNNSIKSCFPIYINPIRNLQRESRHPYWYSQEAIQSQTILDTLIIHSLESLNQYC